jgi:hypothetical protein
MRTVIYPFEKAGPVGIDEFVKSRIHHVLGFIRQSSLAD